MPSAGLVPYRIVPTGLEILIAHPGGPFWTGKQSGAWSIVKGEVPPDEDPLDTALREFREETGWEVRPDNLVALGEVVQKAGKRITAWAFEADFDPAGLSGDTVTIEWHGRDITFAEIDEMRWCGEAEATELLNPAQAIYYERLNAALGRVR